MSGVIALPLRAEGTQADPYTLKNLESIDLRTFGCHMTARAYRTLGPIP